MDIHEINEDNELYDNSHASLYDNLFRANEKLNSQNYVPLAKEDFDISQALVKPIAFYLPQFHPIPENDEWWGKGFTEWTNVRKAAPNFAGHYQPRIPDELGYYDLRDVDVQKRQIELAKKYGIYGFCFYYYWFSGKRLLERPLNQFIENAELDFPFCICWANENWTRRWDGRDDNILIGQTHSEDEYAAFIKDVVPILLNERYIRVNGMPLLAVYRINLLPNPQRAAEIWRAECQRFGVGEIYLVAVQSFDIEDPRPYGFDAAMEFPPHNCLDLAAAVDKSNLHLMNPDFTGHIYEYRVAAQIMKDKRQPDYIKFKTVMPSWDNTARRQNSSDLFINASPEAYKNWLRTAVDYTCKHLPEDRRFLFINAWNEWGEGAYLEPDSRFGYAFLQATLEAVRKPILSDEKDLIRSLETQVANLEKMLITETVKKEQTILLYKMQVLEKDQKIISLNQQMNEIFISKAFKFGLLLRKIREMLLPPGSKCDRFLRMSMSFVYRRAWQWTKYPNGDK